jgi:hypothetical protein
VQEKVDWSQVMEFIARENAAAAASCVGVSPGEIAAVQSRYGITLPSNYVEFLRMMGQSSGGLHVFGATYDHAFSSLLARRPSTDYPTGRFFKVAFETNRLAVSFEDLYLDLTRADGSDAPLVRFEIPLEPDDEVEDEFLTLSEKVIRELFWDLVMVRTKYAGTVLVLGDDASVGPSVKQAATTLLAGLGFSPSLPEVPRIACLRRDTVSVLIEVSEELELVGVRLGGDSHDEVQAAAQALLDGVPDSEMKTPPAPRAEFQT